jgi:hypothetical protein
MQNPANITFAGFLYAGVRHRRKKANVKNRTIFPFLQRGEDFKTQDNQLRYHKKADFFAARKDKLWCYSQFMQIAFPPHTLADFELDMNKI